MPASGTVGAIYGVGLSMAVLQVDVAAVPALPCLIDTLWSQEQERRQVSYSLSFLTSFS